MHSAAITLTNSEGRAYVRRWVRSEEQREGIEWGGRNSLVKPFAVHHRTDDFPLEFIRGYHGEVDTGVRPAGGP